MSSVVKVRRDCHRQQKGFAGWNFTALGREERPIHIGR